MRVNEIAEDDLDPFEALASSRKIIPLDDSHKAADRSPATLRLHHALGRRPSSLADPHQGPGRIAQRSRGQGTGTGRRVCDDLRRPESRQSQLLSVSLERRWLAGLSFFAWRIGGGHLEPGRPRMDDLLLQSPGRPGDGRQTRRRHRRPRSRRLCLQVARRSRPGRQDAGPGRHRRGRDLCRSQDDAQGAQGRPVGGGDRAPQRRR